MSEDVWSARDTTPSAIEAALRELLGQRYQDDRTFVPARVMNLVVIVDRGFRGEVENRLARVGRYHPSRLVICAVEPGAHGDRRLGDGRRRRRRAPAGPHRRRARARGGRHRPAAPRQPRHDRRPAARPRPHDDGVGAARPPRGASTRCAGWRTSCSSTPRTTRGRRPAFARAARPHALRLRRRPRVAALDAVARARRRDLRPAARCAARWARSTRSTVRHRADSTAAGVLFCGWLALAARLAARRRSRARATRCTGHARARRGEVALELRPDEIGAPGLGGVTIEMASGESVALDRGPGGLRAVRAPRDGEEQAGPCSARRAARRASSARACARRCCATRRTSRRSRRAACSSAEWIGARDLDRYPRRRRPRRGGRRRCWSTSPARAGTSRSPAARRRGAPTSSPRAERRRPERRDDVARRRARRAAGRRALERCGMVRAALLDRLPEERRPRLMRGRDRARPDAAAAAYESRLRETLGNHPRLDLVLLGLGPDAHTASLFPGKPALQRDAAPAWSAVPEAGMEPQVPRVTMTCPLLNAAREVVFLVAGADKARRRRARVRRPAGRDRAGGARAPGRRHADGRARPRRGGGAAAEP